MPGRCSWVSGARAMRRAARGAGLPAVPRAGDGISFPRVLHSVGKLPVHGVSGSVESPRERGATTPGDQSVSRPGDQHCRSSALAGQRSPPAIPAGTRAGSRRTRVRLLSRDSPLVIPELRSARSPLSAHSQEPRAADPNQVGPFVYHGNTNASGLEPVELHSKLSCSCAVN